MAESNLTQSPEEPEAPMSLASNFDDVLSNLAESQNLASAAHEMVSKLGLVTEAGELYQKLEVICAILEKSISTNAASSESLQEMQDRCFAPEKDQLADCASELDLKNGGLKVILEQWGRHLNAPSKDNGTDNILLECAERYAAAIDGVMWRMYKAAGIKPN